MIRSHLSQGPLLACLLLLGVAGCSQAGETPRSPQADATVPPAQAPSPSPTTTARPPVLAAIEAKGFEVLGEFAAPSGLRGYAGVAGQQPLAVYVTADGQHALVGTLLDAKGNDAGADAVQRLVAAPMSKRIWTQLEKSRWVADGKADAPRVVYVFTDPNCPYCNRLWENARPWVDAGKVQLRHVMVGVIRPDSATKAAAILSAASPAAALARNERNREAGGIAPVATIPADIRAALDANETLMTQLGFQGTPGILFRDAQGLVQRRSGMPPDSEMTLIFGPR
ncbi:thiol:disulfide interchange protein DsbG [Cognatiluteimonas profundi]|uniref:thiol:disulfide interchange protein DsbG n=1 Tax=Cognatiluteimonas profundi TaxID=2594501 RepID=UPI00131C4730|nr:thiol:disulfide interchange protein DsbG [Lysobacter profundi]